MIRRSLRVATPVESLDVSVKELQSIEDGLVHVEVFVAGQPAHKLDTLCLLGQGLQQLKNKGRFMVRFKCN